MRFLVLQIIRIYQKTLSFDHGPFRHLFPGGFCRFYPSCSEYGHESIDQHGLLKGGWLTIWRIFRCNPLSPGGIDIPPMKKR
jgi:putative membrane protein insertion efficiency factor